MLDMRIKTRFCFLTIYGYELGDDCVVKRKARMSGQYSRCVRRDDIFTRREERNDSRRITPMHYVPASIFDRLSAEKVCEIETIVFRQAWDGIRTHNVALINRAP